MDTTWDRLDYTADVGSPVQMVAMMTTKSLKVSTCSIPDSLKVMWMDEGDFLLEWINIHYGIAMFNDSPLSINRWYTDDRMAFVLELMLSTVIPDVKIVVSSSSSLNKTIWDGNVVYDWLIHRLFSYFKPFWVGVRIWSFTHTHTHTYTSQCPCMSSVITIVW